MYQYSNIWGSLTGDLSSPPPPPEQIIGPASPCVAYFALSPQCEGGGAQILEAAPTVPNCPNLYYSLYPAPWGKSYILLLRIFSINRNPEYVEWLLIAGYKLYIPG